MPVLAVVVWHGSHTARTLSPDYLLSLCYFSNVILAAGILYRSGLLLGVGFGWALIGLPLWIYQMCLTRYVTISSIAFHTTGLCLGFLALRRTRIPRWIVLTAIPTGLFSYLLAKVFTHPQFNINAAFRVQQGWEWAFPNEHVSFLVQLVAYTLYFWYLPVACCSFVYAGDKT